MKSIKQEQFCLSLAQEKAQNLLKIYWDFNAWREIMYCVELVFVIFVKLTTKAIYSYEYMILNSIIIFYKKKRNKLPVFTSIVI